MGKLDKEPRNTKGFLHGYQEWYFYNEICFRGYYKIFRGNYKNASPFGYIESFETAVTRYHIR